MGPLLPPVAVLELETDVARLLGHARGGKSRPTDLFRHLSLIGGELSITEDRHVLDGGGEDAPSVELLLVEGPSDEALDHFFQRRLHLPRRIEKLEAGVVDGEAVGADRESLQPGSNDATVD